MATRKGIFVDQKLGERLQAEIEVLNELELVESISEEGEQDGRKRRKRMKKLPPLTLKSYTEMALDYFLRNHIDPRMIKEEQDVITEVRKLRNNIFAFMQVQERTYLLPFIQDVYQLSKQSEAFLESNQDIINLLEIFIDILLRGLRLSDSEQAKLRDWGARQFAEKKQQQVK